MSQVTSRLYEITVHQVPGDVNQVVVEAFNPSNDLLGTASLELSNGATPTTVINSPGTAK
ncbi:hypothetical protein [Novipirellula artificiosorum]|uniref:hypothetical protein n=1 Tax=Novipirellula artificiosorum TaxID=2528016 RepID=UPI0011B53C0E|nr:hypothetical protein [Novipirellula artificiosorum]